MLPRDRLLTSHAVRKLRARLDAELAEHLAQVVLDRARADEQVSGDLAIRVSLGRKARDLRYFAERKLILDWSETRTITAPAAV